MRKLLCSSTLLALLLWGATVTAQSTSYCPALKNPASFTAGSTWGANIGYYTGQRGSKNSNAANALTGQTGYTMTTSILTASQLASLNSEGSEYAAYGCGTTLYPTRRFLIMNNTDGPGTGANVGKDPITSYALPYTPQAYDSTITKSIRLSSCLVDGAEALYYNMKVSINNCQLMLYYAIVASHPTHGSAGSPAFVMRIGKQVGGQWQQVSDTLCYALSSTNALYDTVNWHSYGTSDYYRSWNRAIVDLSNYLYEDIRVEFYMGACLYNNHYGYAYIAGDCQSKGMQTSGCPAGSPQTVQTLTAPSGLINYVWYKCNVDGREVMNIANIPESIHFTQLTPDTSADNTYNCTLEDFRILEGADSGQYTNLMVFRCDMTSAMDPAKPYISKLYVLVLNTKPMTVVDTLMDSEGNLQLTDRSFVPGTTDGCDTSLTQWRFYSGADTLSLIVDSAVGGTAHHQYDSTGVYAITVRSFNAEDPSCYTDSTLQLAITRLSIYNVEVSSADSTMGTSSGSGAYTQGDTIVIEAIPAEHHHFVQWNDGNTDNPRSVVVTGDAAYVAYFEIDHFNVTATSSDITMGIVSGGGTYDYGTQATLTATPNSGFVFSRWSNDIADNPYTFTVIDDVDLTAIFEQEGVGIGGVVADKTVTLHPNPTSGTVTIEAEGLLSVEVYDGAGRRVAEHRSTRLIDLSPLPDGTYTLRITTTVFTATRKVVKGER